MQEVLTYFILEYRNQWKAVTGVSVARIKECQILWFQAQIIISV